MSCQQSFLSPIHCHLHIRRVHIRGRTLRKVNQLSAERNLCKLCSYSSRFAKQLQNHMIRVHSGRRCKSTNFHSQDLAVEAGCSGTKSSEPMDTHAQVSENCEGQFVMQAFQLQECCQNSNFVTSVVKMPVRQRVSESVAVTFLLAPAEVWSNYSANRFFPYLHAIIVWPMCNFFSFPFYQILFISCGVIWMKIVLVQRAYHCLRQQCSGYSTTFLHTPSYVGCERISVLHLQKDQKLFVCYSSVSVIFLFLFYLPPSWI